MTVEPGGLHRHAAPGQAQGRDSSVSPRSARASAAPHSPATSKGDREQSERLKDHHQLGTIGDLLEVEKILGQRCIGYHRYPDGSLASVNEHRVRFVNGEEGTLYKVHIPGRPLGLSRYLSKNDRPTIDVSLDARG